MTSRDADLEERPDSRPSPQGEAKYRRSISLPEVERWAVAIAAAGAARGKVGVLLLKRKAGAGQPTPPLMILTVDAWTALTLEPAPSEPRDASREHRPAPPNNPKRNPSWTRS